MRISDWSSDVCSSDLIPEPTRDAPSAILALHHPYHRSIRMSEATTTDDQLRLFIESIERMEEEKQGVGDDIRGTYNDAKSQCCATKIMRPNTRLRSMTGADRRETEADHRWKKRRGG